MKRLTAMLAASLLLLACSKDDPPPEPVRPVLSMEVKAEDQETLGRFAGTIQARYESNLGFRVPGRIARRAVDVGAEVEKGAVLAVLDPTDQQNQLRAGPRRPRPRAGAVRSTPRPTPVASRNCSTVASAPRPSWTWPRPT